MIKTQNEYYAARNQLHAYEEALYRLNMESNEYPENDRSDAKRVIESTSASFYSVVEELKNEIYEWEART